VKVYSAQVTVNGTKEQHLVQAASKKAARDFLLQIVEVRTATQEDLLLAVSGDLKIEKTEE